MDRVTKPQKKMLISLLRETKYMEGKKEKEWYWEKIQAALNTIGPKKTIIQWKKCWRDMRLTTRKKLAEMKRCQSAGGSPPPGIELNQEDNDIIDIVGSEYFYEEMGGELKPENFMTGFEYVPEQFCDAILSAAAVSSSQSNKDAGHPTQDGHDGDGPDTAGTSNQDHQHGSNFPPSAVGVHHNGESNGPGHHGAFPGISAAAAAACGHQHLHHRRREAAAAAAAAAMHRESAFEEKLLQLMQDAFPKKDRKRKKRDPDKLFLLSLYEEIKKVPEETRLDVKAELIQVLKRYQKKGPHKSNIDKSSSKQLQSADKMQRQDSQQLHPQQQLPHSMYQLQKKYEKNVEKSDQQQTTPTSQQQAEAQQRQQQHSQQTRDSNDTQRMHAQQQISHNMFQMQKKYAEENDKVHQQQQQQQQQNDQQRKQLVETQPHPHQQSQQPPPPPPPTSSNDQHLHHPQMTHGIMFPLPQIRNEHPHQQQPQPHPHQQHHQHHPAPLFTTTPPSAMAGDRSMTYENVG